MSFHFPGTFFKEACWWFVSFKKEKRKSHVESRQQTSVAAEPNAALAGGAKISHLRKFPVCFYLCPFWGLSSHFRATWARISAAFREARGVAVTSGHAIARLDQGDPVLDCSA